MSAIPEEFQSRYSRHLALPEVGPAGQLRLQQARVLCLGAGGLGSPALLYLAAAGVGHLGVLDFDTVDLSNLQRQILHDSNAVGRPKVDSAVARLRALNPGIDIQPHPVRVTADNIMDLVRGYDVVLDGTDNFPTRYVVNDACVLLRKPLVYGAVQRFEGQASVFAPHLGAPCYRCLFPEPPPPGFAPSCADAGVLGVLPGIIGTLQATETLKFILGAGNSLRGRLLVFDALAMSFREVRVQRDPGCPVCGAHPTITRPVAPDAPSCQAPSANPASPGDEVDIAALERALEDPSLGIVVLDVREADEHREAHIPGTRLLPLSQLTARAGELDPAQPYYIHCRSGVRSLQAVRFLQAQGFARVHSVRGGILAWQARPPSAR